MELENQYRDICFYDSKVEILKNGNREPRLAFFMGKSGMGKSYCFERLLELGNIDTHYGGEMGDQYLKESSYYEAGIQVKIFDTISIDFLEIDYQRDNDIKDKKEAYYEYKALFEQGFHRIFVFVKYDRVPIMKENIKTTMLQLRKVSKNITLIITQAPFEEKQFSIEEFNSLTKFYNISQNVIVLGKEFDIGGLKSILLKFMWNDQLIRDFSIEGTLFDDKFSNDMSKETKECFQQLQQQIKNVQCSCQGNHKYSCKYYQAPQVFNNKDNFKQVKPTQEAVQYNSNTKNLQINTTTQNTSQKLNDNKDNKDNKYNKDNKDNKDNRDNKNNKDNKDNKDNKEYKDTQWVDSNNLNYNQQEKATSLEINQVSTTNQISKKISTINSQDNNSYSQSNKNGNQVQQQIQFDTSDYLSIPKALIKQIQYKIVFTGFKNNFKQMFFNKISNNKSIKQKQQQECSFIFDQVNVTIILQDDLASNYQQQSNISSIKQICSGIHKIYLFIDMAAYDLTQSIDILNNLDFPINNITLVLNNANENIYKRDQLINKYFVIYNIETLEGNNLQELVNKDILQSKSLEIIKTLAPQNTQQKTSTNTSSNAYSNISSNTFSNTSQYKQQNTQQYAQSNTQWKGINQKK